MDSTELDDTECKLYTERMDCEIWQQKGKEKKKESE